MSINQTLDISDPTMVSLWFSCRGAWVHSGNIRESQAQKVISRQRDKLWKICAIDTNPNMPEEERIQDDCSGDWGDAYEQWELQEEERQIALEEAM
jgi:hypothetical protein